MTEKDKQNYFTIYTMFWKLFKRYSTLEDSDQYWKDLLHEADAVRVEMDQIDPQLSMALATATLATLERCCKSRREVGAI